MAIKTFNVDEETYRQFANYCKKQGVSMSKRVENFIKEELTRIKDKNPKKMVDKKGLPHQALHSFSKYC